MGPLFEDFGGSYHVGLETGVELGVVPREWCCYYKCTCQAAGRVGETAGRSLHKILTMVRNAQCHVSLLPRLFLHLISKTSLWRKIKRLKRPRKRPA